MNPRSRLVPAAVLAAVVLGVMAFLGAGRDHTVTAYFANSNGIYEGDDVRMLGVPIGTIDEIEPTGDGARVTFHVDDDVLIPADAQAAIVSPSLVSSRYIQLAPQYDGGPTMDDGSVIPLDRTAVPVEFDQIKQELNDLATGFGPNGLNKDGSLSDFVTTTGRALAGKGQQINDTIGQLDRAVELLGTARDDIFGTVDNLQTFVTVLATSDQQIREFGGRLDVVAAILANNRKGLRIGLQELGLAVRDVRGFVHDNQARIVRTARGLGDVLVTVANQRQAIEQILHAGPNALRNLLAAYHSNENSVAAGLQTANTHNLRQLVCGAVGSVGPMAVHAAQTCANTLGPLLDALSSNLPLSSELLHELEASLGLAGGAR